MPAPKSRDPFGVALHELQRRVTKGATFAHASSRAAEIMLRRRAPHTEELDAFMETLAARPLLPPLYFLAIQLAVHLTGPPYKPVFDFLVHATRQAGLVVLDPTPERVAARLLAAIDKEYDDGFASDETLDDVPIVDVRDLQRVTAG